MEIKAPRGTHDIMPDEIQAWQYVEGIIRDHCAHYGYSEARTPVFEHTEVFSRGVGDTTDIVQKEMYTFNDKGNRSITLRPENTAGLVRAFLEHHLQNEPLPIKLYYLSAPMFRYENPQSGRYRQFYQFGVEAYGAPAPSCDAEVVSLAWTLLQKLGIHDLELHINSIGCPKCRPAFQEKLKAYFRQYEGQLCQTCLERLDRNPLRIIDCKSPVCTDIVRDAPTMLDSLCGECQSHFDTLKAYFDAMGIAYVVDPMIVRGLDYYTKTVFEIVSKDIGAQGTVCGGGRYDMLVSQMGGPEMAGVGFAFGMERLLMVMQSLGLLPKRAPLCDVYVAALPDEAARMAAFALCASLRAQGVKAEVDHVSRSLKAQLKHAGKIGSRACVIIGADELAAGVVKLRDMQRGEEQAIAMETATEAIAAILK
nr:histidine--tRNA ligase [Maliibacterium massiliense]